MPTLLVIDTETGGLDPEEDSLLKLGAVLWKDGRISQKFEVWIRHEKYFITAEALEVNRINIAKHHKKAVPQEEALRRFVAYVKKCFPIIPPGGIPLGGHNLDNLDVPILKRLFRECGEDYRQYFSHRTINTAALMRFLFLLGIVPEEATSSDGAFAFFQIPFGKGERHTALGDAKATALLLNRALEVVAIRMGEDEGIPWFIRQLGHTQ